MLVSENSERLLSGRRVQKPLDKVRSQGVRLASLADKVRTRMSRVLVLARTILSTVCI